MTSHSRIQPNQELINKQLTGTNLTNIAFWEHDQNFPYKIGPENKTVLPFCITLKAIYHRIPILYEPI